MKTIIENKELLDNLIKSIHLLCDPVSTTLGPKGRNIIVCPILKMPFITNDGVTIAKNIESSDKVIDTLLTILKEASLKTDSLVGDGTTTTLVLLRSIMLNGIKEIENNLDPITLTKNINATVDEILKQLNTLKIKPTAKDLQKIAITSANDKTLGTSAYQAFNNTKNKNGIKIKMSNNKETYVEYIKGYQIEAGLANPFLLKNKEYTLKDSYILLFDNDLENISFLSDIINEIIDEKKSLVIFANSFSDEIINQAIEINNQSSSCLVLINNIDYLIKRQDSLEDLENLLNISINKDTFNPQSLGTVDLIKGNVEETLIYKKNINKELIKKHIIKIKKEIARTTDEYNLEYLNERLSKLKEKNAIIYIGGVTKTEVKEKMMRVNDALFALSIANEGILLGGGISYLKVRSKLKDNDIGTKIMKKALEEPFLQILKNSGLDKDKIYNEIKKHHYNYVYNITTNKYEDLKKTMVIDPYLVLKNALLTSTSIATMLLTTTYLVINEDEIIKNNSEL